MRIFAIELSSKLGGVAVLEDGAVVVEKTWEENFKNRQQLFDSLNGLDVDWTTIDHFSVGRGPGAFSGMRIGFTVVNALAAPDQKPVYALNSGAALAAQHGAGKSVVVGDARRDKVWAGVFADGELQQEFELMERAALKAFVPADAVVLSPDRDRLEDLLAEYEGPDEPVYPTAAMLGKLVHERIARGVASEPFEPLYMHPPVFIEPRFPG